MVLIDRALNFDWTGNPTTDPDLAVFSQGTSAISAYASWNGATEIASWKLLGSTNQTGSDPVSIGGESKTGFETVISATLSDDYSFFSVQAIDAEGNVIGQSSFVQAQ
jgi:hypothetical protein